jgi:holo-ACP synthase
MLYSVDDILLAREARVELQKKLMNEYKLPLLCMKVNYPGLNKNNSISNNILQNMDMIVSDIFSKKVEMKLIRNTAEGPSVTMLLKDAPRNIKDITIQVEEKHLLGRCVDIDIYDYKNGRAISRSDLGIPLRRCFICDDLAQNCVRSKRHNESEVIKFIHDSYKEFMENFYGKKV